MFIFIGVPCTEFTTKCSLRLIRLVYLQACGAKYHIREELLDETNVDDVVVALVELARNVSCSSSLLCLSLFMLLSYAILCLFMFHFLTLSFCSH